MPKHVHSIEILVSNPTLITIKSRGFTKRLVQRLIERLGTSAAIKCQQRPRNCLQLNFAVGPTIWSDWTDVIVPLLVNDHTYYRAPGNEGRDIVVTYYGPGSRNWQQTAREVYPPFANASEWVAAQSRLFGPFWYC